MKTGKQKPLFVIGMVPAALVVLLMLLTGCGGGNNPSRPDSSRGAMAVTIYWPEPTGRLVPIAAKSVKVVLSDPQTTELVAEDIAQRPPSGSGETTLSFPRLLPRQILIRATAYPNIDGTGNAQATGATEAVIRLGETTNANLTMDTTIDRFEIKPASLSLVKGGSRGVLHTAYDSQNRVVMTKGNQVQWSSDNPALVTMNGAVGIVTAVTTGNTVIRVRDTETGKEASVPVNVVAGPGGQVAANYTVIDLGDIPNSQQVDPRDINDHTEIIGYSYLNPEWRAWVWRDGVMTILPYHPSANGGGSHAWDINNAGQISGVASILPVLWDRDGTVNNLRPDLGPNGSWVLALNERGEAVGMGNHEGTGEGLALYQHAAYDKPARRTSFVVPVMPYFVGLSNNGQIVFNQRVNNVEARGSIWKNGQVQDMDTLGGAFTYTSIWAANDQGTVMARGEFNNQPVIIRWSENGPPIATPGEAAPINQVLGVNNYEVIVGEAGTPTYAFARDSNGTIINLNTRIPANSGWTLEIARRINNRGEIIGLGRKNGQVRAFLLKPLP